MDGGAFNVNRPGSGTTSPTCRRLTGIEPRATVRCAEELAMTGLGFLRMLCLSLTTVVLLYF